MCGRPSASTATAATSPTTTPAEPGPATPQSTTDARMVPPAKAEAACFRQPFVLSTAQPTQRVSQPTQRLMCQCHGRPGRQPTNPAHQPANPALGVPWSRTHQLEELHGLRMVAVRVLLPLRNFLAGEEEVHGVGRKRTWGFLSFSVINRTSHSEAQ